MNEKKDFSRWNFITKSLSGMAGAGLVLSQSPLLAQSMNAKKEINADIYFNKLNGNADWVEYLDRELYDERYGIESTNVWMYTSVRCPTGWIPSWKARKDSSIWCLT